MAFLNQYLPIYETPPFLQPTHLRKFGISLIGLHYCMQIIIMYFLHIYQSYMACSIGY